MKKNKDTFVTGYGEYMKVGQNFKINEKVFKIISLNVVRWAGLIASYEEDGVLKKTNVSHYVWLDSENLWCSKQRGKNDDK